MTFTQSDKWLRVAYEGRDKLEEALEGLGNRDYRALVKEDPRLAETIKRIAKGQGLENSSVFDLGRRR